MVKGFLTFLASSIQKARRASDELYSLLWRALSCTKNEIFERTAGCCSSSTSRTYGNDSTKRKKHFNIQISGGSKIQKKNELTFFAKNVGFTFTYVTCTFFETHSGWVLHVANTGTKRTICWTVEGIWVYMSVLISNGFGSLLEMKMTDGISVRNLLNL